MVRKKTTKRVAKRKTAKRIVAKKKAPPHKHRITAKRTAKRKPKVAFTKPVVPSKALATVLGSKPASRAVMAKKLWSYIKRHQLQDARDRRMIHADANLAVVFGGRLQVSMFEMTKLVSRHLAKSPKEEERPPKKGRRRTDSTGPRNK